MKNLREEKKIKIKKITNITLLRRRGENVVHFSSNANQLDDPLILPMPSALRNIQVVLHVVQFNDFRFFLSHSPLLGRLGLVCDGRCKPNSRKRRHEGVREEKRHLTPMVWKTWKKLCAWDANTLCSDIATHNRRIGSGDVNWVAWAALCRVPCESMENPKPVTKKISTKRKVSQKN